MVTSRSRHRQLSSLLEATDQFTRVGVSVNGSHRNDVPCVNLWLFLIMYRVLVMLVVSLSEALPRRKNEREYRAIVPQLLPNYTTSTLPPAHQVNVYLSSMLN